MLINGYLYYILAILRHLFEYCTVLIRRDISIFVIDSIVILLVLVESLYPLWIGSLYMFMYLFILRCNILLICYKTHLFVTIRIRSPFLIFNSWFRDLKSVALNIPNFLYQICCHKRTTPCYFHLLPSHESIFNITAVRHPVTVGVLLGCYNVFRNSQYHCSLCWVEMIPGVRDSIINHK